VTPHTVSTIVSPLDQAQAKPVRTLRPMRKKAAAG
jgi:hypothetical protein